MKGNNVTRRLSVTGTSQNIVMGVKFSFKKLVPQLKVPIYILDILVPSNILII
jgi:hypothetical protein